MYSSFGYNHVDTIFLYEAMLLTWSDDMSRFRVESQ